MRAVPALPTNPPRHREENFPVASWLCPPRLRPPILAIYRFARFADDLADEGAVAPTDRQAALARLRASLLTAAQGGIIPSEHHTLLTPLQAAMHTHRLPLPLLTALLDAFEHDTRVQQHPDRAALLAYCRNSANPVGRLLLHLAGVHGAAALQASDAICTGLQLVNFWQDVGVDRLKGRVYIPLNDLQRHGLTPAAVLHGQDSPALRACLAELNTWAVQLLEQGRALPALVPGRLSWELRLVIEGGLRIAEKIRALDHATLLSRPRLRPWDAALMLARALRPRRLKPAP